MSERTDAGGTGAGLIDWEAVRALTGGDDALLDDIVELFPVESARHLQAIRTAIDESDADGLERAAHTLKSAARMFGAEALVAVALKMETLGREANVGAAAELLPQLESDAAQVVDALERERPGRGAGEAR